VRCKNELSREIESKEMDASGPRLLTNFDINDDGKDDFIGCQVLISLLYHILNCALIAMTCLFLPCWIFCFAATVMDRLFGSLRNVTENL
jgi:hypothetical protein